MLLIRVNIHAAYRTWFNPGGQALDYCVACVGFGDLMHKTQSEGFAELNWLFLYFPSILLLLRLLEDSTNKLLFKKY